MTEAECRAASDLLLAHWRDGRRMAMLPAALRPASRAEGYAIQALVERETARPLAGWKIAATSAAGQVHIGVNGPIAGRLLAERMLESGAALPLGANHFKVAEIEFAFRLARDLPPRAAEYGMEEVLDAVGSLHPAIEIPDTRYDAFETVGAAQLIADNACAHWFVLGSACDAEWRGLDLAALPVRGHVDDAVADGVGANVLGDPRIALAWIANELSAVGIGLRAGQVVTTGTCVTPMPIHAGATVRGDLGPVGRVELRLT